jgi:PiT family inorganic phosphate transporter
VIVLGLMITGQLDEFVVPTWVVLVCAAALSAGGATGGWRLIRTLGGKFYKVRPIHGFNNQLASAAVILGAALLGGPVSTTQVVSTALLGVGAAERPNKVRWGVAGNILTAWLLTIPLTGILGLLFNLALSQIPSLNQTLATLR